MDKSFFTPIFIQFNKCAKISDLLYRTNYQVIFSRPSASLHYSRTSTICVLTNALPPVGSDNVLPHTRHLTDVLAHPKITCSFSQSLHLTFKNLLFGSMSTTPQVQICQL